MEMVEHTVVLRGEAVAGGRPRPEALGRVLRYIEPVVRESVSMGFRNTSRRPGRPPQWFQQATDIRFVGLSAAGDEGTVLHFEAPRFAEAAGDLYRQGQLFRVRPSETDTGFDLLGDAIDDVRRGNSDSCRYDAPMLNTMHRLYGAASRGGIERVVFLGDRLREDDPVSLDEAVSSHAERMRQITPPEQRARIAGKLDMIRDSDSVFEIILEAGETVRGIWTPGEMADLQAFFRADVLMEGVAVYRASGMLLRLEADVVSPASARDRLFRRVPAPMARSTRAPATREPQTPASGANALFGRWPGDETEEELLAAFEESE